MQGAGGDPQPIEAAVLIAEILDLAEKLREQLDAPCNGHGVSASRFAVLESIQQSGSQGLAQTQLAGRLKLSESNVSVLVEALRKAGLLHRLRSKADRRRSVLLLSETGQELVALLGAARNAVVDSLIAGIPDRQIADLRRLLCDLSRRLDSNNSAMLETSRSSHRSPLRRAS